jgi:hypothetical protein
MMRGGGGGLTGLFPSGRRGRCVRSGVSRCRRGGRMVYVLFANVFLDAFNCAHDELCVYHLEFGGRGVIIFRRQGVLIVFVERGCERLRGGSPTQIRKVSSLINLL